MKPTIIFDFDGTIADTIELGLKIYNELAPKMRSLPIAKEEFPELRKLSYKQIIRKKRLNLMRLPWLLRIVPRRMKRSMHEVNPYPGMVSLLTNLIHDGYRVGVLTSNRVDVLQVFFHTHQFPQLSFVESERSIFGKDKGLKKVMKRYSLKRDEILYVGDEPRDVSACRKLRIHVIGVTWGIAGREGLKRDEPDKYADNTEELDALLRSYPW